MVQYLVTSSPQETFQFFNPRSEAVNFFPVVSPSKASSEEVTDTNSTTNYEGVLEILPITKLGQRILDKIFSRVSLNIVGLVVVLIGRMVNTFCNKMMALYCIFALWNFAKICFKMLTICNHGSQANGQNQNLRFQHCCSVLSQSRLECN